MKLISWRTIVGYIALGAALTFFIPFATLFAMKKVVQEIPIDEVVARQSKDHKLLYLSGLDQDVAQYKLLLTLDQGPDVLVLGSSRAMQVRSSFFSVPMINWGGAVNSLGHFEWAAQQIRGLAKPPRLIILFVDVWWFNDRFQVGSAIFAPRPTSAFRNIYRNNQILVREIFRKGLKRTENRIGMAAIQSDQGYDFAGSFHYVATVSQRGVSTDIQFKETLGRVDEGSGRFMWNETANLSAVERFRNIKSTLEATGAEVVAIMPPFAGPVIERMMSSGNFEYVARLRETLKSDVYDYTEAALVPGATDCEYVDGSHAGEVVYARMLVDAAVTNPRLRSALDLPSLQAWIQKNAGSAAPSTLQYANGKTEVDFLELGCRKPSS